MVAAYALGKQRCVERGNLCEFQVRENHIVIAWGGVSGAEGGRALA